MSYNIIATPQFKKEIKRLAKKFHSLKNDYAALIEKLQENPAYGTPIGNRCYKIRLAISSKNKGKSGGARVITYALIENNTVFLITIYDKSEQGNISTKELATLLKEIK